MSVVVPFIGSDHQLQALEQTLGALDLGPDDELIISDNRRHEVRTPGYARNRGAAQARGEWLLFLDADARPQRDLIAVYFTPLPDHSTAILAGGVKDVADSPSWVARHAVARAQMSHQATLQRAGRPYAQTVNCAVRREAFAAVGGFAERARAGEDADLCFRLQDAGWAMEHRPAAQVSHGSRPRLASWLVQLAVHGAGAAWLQRRWPGQFPPPSPVQFAARLIGYALATARAAAHGELEAAVFGLLDAAGACAFELGRLVPNERRSRREAHLRGFRR